MKRVAIIGGGMAGLAAAHALHQAGAGKRDWHLFEQHHRVGGKIVTDQVDGFTIEGGPDSFITQKPWGLDLCRELGLNDELIPCNQEAAKVYILVNGKLCALPAGFRLTVPTRIMPFLRSPLFSWRAKLRMMWEPFVPPARDGSDESISAFITRRLGREAADKIGGPLMAGIYVADPDRLSLLSTFPIFKIMERKHGSLMRAMRVAARKPASGQPMFMSLRNGMQQLVDTLHTPLADRCHTNARVTHLQRDRDGFVFNVNDEPLRFDAVIVATPLHEAARLLSGICPESARELEAIRYVSTATVSLGFPLPLAGVAQPLDGFGFVIPRSEKRSILACTWSSIKFANRAPENHALIRVFIGGAGNEHLLEESDTDLVQRARAELRHIIGLTAAPVLTRVYRWPHGNPQYDVGHADRMAALTERLHAIPGLRIAGSGYHGIGLPDCIHSGQQAAAQVDPSD